MPACAPAPLCRHLDTVGAPCGSPALRGKPVCFYHDAARQPLAVARDLGRVLPNLPAPDDLYAIQIGYSQLLRLIAQDEVAPRTATLLLRTLAHASQNLARIHRRERTHPVLPVNDLVLDPTYGSLAPEPTTVGAPSLPASSERVGPTQPGAPRLASETLVRPNPQPIPPAETPTDLGAPPSRPHLAVRVGSTEPEPTTAGAPRLASETWVSAPGTQPGASSFPVSSERMGYRAPEHTTALADPANDPQAPTPTPRQAPELPAAPPSGPLTLAEQYILADRDHTLDPAAHAAAFAAITARLLEATPEDRQRDQDILAARTQRTPNQYFTENEENRAAAPDHLVLVHATAA